MWQRSPGGGGASGGMVAHDLVGVRRQPDGMIAANLQRSHPRRGASMGDIYITMITSGASCRDAATGDFATD